MQAQPTFEYPPSVTVLERLAKGSLRQNFAKALRLWAILQSLYGEIDPLTLPDHFTYNQWRDEFFTQTRRSPTSTDTPQSPLHHRRDKIPILHDPNCRCARTISDWLFDPRHGQTETSWRINFMQRTTLTEPDLNRLLTTGNATLQANRKRPPLENGRLFAITGKELQNYFRELAQNGWLDQVGSTSSSKTYRRVNILPPLFDTAPLDNPLPLAKITELFPPNVSDWIGDFTHPINGIIRAKAHLEYIIPNTLSDHVQALQNQLKQGWAESPVTPILVHYHSAQHFMTLKDPPLKLVVYPVRIDYLQRATYLYAYGQTPPTTAPDLAEIKSTVPNDNSKPALNWYDFRLDRISALHPLRWDSPEVPRSLTALFNQQQLPTVEQLEREQLDIWGFDIHRQPALLLLRFDPYFHAQYVANTERDHLLRPITLNQVKHLIRQAQLQSKTLHSRQVEHLHRILEKHHNSIYCSVSFRFGDNNITMRLRAWGPKVEVLLPWSLRKHMASDIRHLIQLYEGV